MYAILYYYLIAFLCIPTVTEAVAFYAGIFTNANGDTISGVISQNVK